MPSEVQGPVRPCADPDPDPPEGEPVGLLAGALDDGEGAAELAGVEAAADEEGDTAVDNVVGTSVDDGAAGAEEEVAPGVVTKTPPDEGVGSVPAAEEVGAGEEPEEAGGDPDPSPGLTAFAPLGTQFEPEIGANLFCDPGFMTLEPGLGYCGSEPNSDLQSLISARLVTVSSGKASSLEKSSIVSLL
jgi:hypothetical protein